MFNETRKRSASQSSPKASTFQACLSHLFPTWRGHLPDVLDKKPGLLSLTSHICLVTTAKKKKREEEKEKKKPPKEKEKKS